jgi:hypothetical protein
LRYPGADEYGTYPMAAPSAGHSVVSRSRDEPETRHQEATTAMHPAIMYNLAQAKIDDEHRAADKRRLARLAAESRPPRSGGVSIVGRVWTLLTGVNPSKRALTGTAQ